MTDVYRHVKTGGRYEVLCINASLQCSAAPDFERMFEDEHFIVYQNVATRAVYIRPYEEFHDGRFKLEDGDVE